VVQDQQITNVYAQCRVGLKWQTNDDGTDTGALHEKVAITVEGRR
jgi:hypothetical protein